MTLPLSDAAALTLSYAWAAALLLLAVVLRRAASWSALSVRKALHVGAGLWVIPTVFVFGDWRMAVVPSLSFMVANLIIHRFSHRFGHHFRRTEKNSSLLTSFGDDPSNLGVVFFPLSFAVLLALFFRPGSPDDAAFLAVAGVLTMTLGDTAAAVFGRRYGTRRYTILGHSRTMEGSLAMFLVSGATIAVVMTTMADFAWHPAVAFGLVTGTVAAGIEAACPFGSDNLFVPLGTAAVLWALVRISGAALGVPA